MRGLRVILVSLAILFFLSNTIVFASNEIDITNIKGLSLNIVREDGKSYLEWDKTENRVSVVYFTNELGREFEIFGLCSNGENRVLIDKFGYYLVKNISVQGNDYVSNIIRFNIKADNMVNPAFDLSKVDFYVSNGRSYNWYFTQNETGAYSDINCGPAVTSMAIKWVKSEFEGMVKGLREESSKSGWWTTDDVAETLKSENLDFRFITIRSVEDIIWELDKGRVIVLCVDTNHLNFSSNNKWIGRYYNPSEGHFILAKGYVVMGDQVYIETYDPVGGNFRMIENPGMDRYYLAEDLLSAIEHRWEYSISVLD